MNFGNGIFEILAAWEGEVPKGGARKEIDCGNQVAKKKKEKKKKKKGNQVSKIVREWGGNQVAKIGRKKKKKKNLTI